MEREREKYCFQGVLTNKYALDHMFKYFRSIDDV